MFIGTPCINLTGWVFYEVIIQLANIQGAPQYGK